MNPPVVEFPVAISGLAAFIATAQTTLPKIELHRAGTGRPLFFSNDPDIIAIATDEDELAHDPGGLPCLSINDPVAIAEFIQYHIARGRRLKPDVAC